MSTKDYFEDKKIKKIEEKELDFLYERKKFNMENLKPLSKKQQLDIETLLYFIPSYLDSIVVTENDKRMFLEHSEKGFNRNKVNSFNIQDGFNVLVEAKRWRGIHIHELYEPGVLDGTMPYYTLLGGGDKPIPRCVVDFLKKEMFQGRDADIIEKTYQLI